MLCSRAVEEVARRQDVGLSNVELGLGEIAYSPERIAVGTPRQFAHYVQLVLAVRCVEEPGPLFHQRPGNGHPGRPVIEIHSLAILNRGKEISGVEPVSVVPYSCPEIQHATRSLAVFRRIPAVLQVDGTYGVGADPEFQQPADGLSDGESV